MSCYNDPSMRLLNLEASEPTKSWILGLTASGLAVIAMATLASQAAEPALPAVQLHSMAATRSPITHMPLRTAPVPKAAKLPGTAVGHAAGQAVSQAAPLNAQVLDNLDLLEAAPASSRGLLLLGAFSALAASFVLAVSALFRHRSEKRVAMAATFGKKYSPLQSTSRPQSHLTKMNMAKEVIFNDDGQVRMCVDVWLGVCAGAGVC